MKRTKLHALDSESARMRIKAAKSNRPFMTALLDRDHRGHREVVEQWTRSHTAAFPEPVRQDTKPQSLRGRQDLAESSGGEGTVKGRRANRDVRVRRSPGRFDTQTRDPIEEQDDWTEHWFAEGRHFYDRVSQPICAASECSLEDVVAVLNKTGVHPNQSEEFFPVQPYIGDVDLLGPFGRDDVTTSAVFEGGV